MGNDLKQCAIHLGPKGPSFLASRDKLMSDFQFWTMFSSVLALIATGIGWIVTWVKGLGSRIARLEIEIAVLKALEEKRK